MVADAHSVSAFAFYNSLVGPSSSKKRRQRRNITADSLNTTELSIGAQKIRDAVSPLKQPENIKQKISSNLQETNSSKQKSVPEISTATAESALVPVLSEESHNESDSQGLISAQQLKKKLKKRCNKSVNDFQTKKKKLSRSVTNFESTTLLNNGKANKFIEEQNVFVECTVSNAVDTDISNAEEECISFNSVSITDNGDKSLLVDSVNNDDKESNATKRRSLLYNDSGMKLAPRNTLCTCDKIPIPQLESVKKPESKKIPREDRLKRLEKKVKNLSKEITSSSHIGKKVLESMISPHTSDMFFKEFWEKKPFLISRHDPNYFRKYMSISDIDNILRYSVLNFTKNIDITSYSNGVRETHNPVGRAYPHVVWDYYSNGCSVRILNPQTYLPKIHTLLAALQELFGCFVGSNVYLTPPNSQGFAPHYDDIEAFVLQVEGSKRWKVYSPRSPEEYLPRDSSPNFSQDEIGEPIINTVLNAGDILYFPRGYIHQAETLEGHHSLHITISAYQKNAWIDLLEKAMPAALATASRNNVEYRRGLPLGYLQHAGMAHPSGSMRNSITAKVKRLVQQLDQYINIDQAVDEMGVKFMHQALPPVLTEEESKCTVHNSGLRMDQDANLIGHFEMKKSTRIRLLRANCCRLVEELVESEGICVKLYTTVENSKVFEEELPQFLVLTNEMIPAVRHLMSTYPGFITVGSLPLPTAEEKLIFAGDLWDRGILMTDSTEHSGKGKAKTSVSNVFSVESH